MSIVTQEIQDSVSSLYIAFFGRAPDAEGFGYWSQLQADGVSPYAQAADFARSTEWTSQYGGLTPTQQVERFYLNVLDRAADAEGLAYWVAEIEGGLPFSSVAYQIVWAAFTGGDTVDPADNALVMNKVDVAEYFAIDLASNDITLAQTAFVGVTSDPATATAAEVRLSAAVNVGETFTLTTGTDTITGTSKNDSFNANLGGTNVDTMTLNATDSLNGAGGTDTLNVQLANIAADTSITARALNNIEVVNLTSLEPAAEAAVWTVNLVNAPQVTNVNNIGSTGGLIVSNIVAGAALGVSGVASETTEFQYATITGAADTASLSVDNVTGAAAAQITIDGIETVTVTASGTASVVQLDMDSANTVNFAGSVAQTITLGAATINTELFDGRTATGAINLTLINQTGATTDVSVYGGLGNDTLAVGSQIAQDTYVNGGAGNDVISSVVANITSADTYIGGDGVDTLSLNAEIATSAIGARFSQFETLSFSAAATQNMGVYTDSVFTRVNNAFGGAVTFNNAAATVATLGVVAGSTTSLARATDTSADALTVAVEGTSVVTAVTANNEESITITSNRAAGTSVATTGTITTLSASDLTNLTATGTDSLVTTLVGSTALAAVTTTGLAGTLNLDASVSTTSLTANLGAGNSTVTSGSGNDIINGGAGNDSLSGGAGNDSITGGNGTNILVAGSGSDTLIGGTGVDTFVFAANLTSGDSVVGGDGNDILTATLSAGTISPASVSGVETFTLTASGGAFNAVNVTGLNTLNVTSTAATSFSNLGNSVTAINQDANTGSGVSYGFATGASANVVYSANGAVGVNVENGSTTFSNVATLSIRGDNNGADGVGSSLNTGALNGGSALTTLNINSLNALATGADADNTVTVGAITGSGLTTLNIGADAADVTVGASTLAALTGLTVSTTTAGADVSLAAGGALTAVNLTSVNINATAGDVLLGTIGTAGDATSSIDLTSLTVNATGVADVTVGDMFLGTATSGFASKLNSVSLSAGTGNIAVGAMLATGASVSSFGVTLGASTGPSTIGALTAAAVSAIDITTGNGSGTLVLSDVEAATIGNVTIANNDNVTFDNLGATGGTLGNIVVTGTGATAGVVTITSDDVLSLGTVDTTGSSAANVITLNNATLIGTSMTAGSGNTTFVGTGGADVITGGAGNDILSGNSGADVIVGGAGNDVITGGAGADVLTGGAGADRFVYTTAATSVGAAGVNTDIISDFTTAVDDVVLTAGAGTLLAGVTLTGASTAATLAANVVDATSVASLAAVYTAIAANTAFSVDANFLGSAAAAGADQIIAKTISFANGAAAGTYLVINNSVDAFQANSDLVIGLGVAANPVVFVAGDFIIA